MPAPNPSFIEKTPPPLNVRDFPMRIRPIPAAWLRDFGHILAATAPNEPSAAPLNPHRFE